MPENEPRKKAAVIRFLVPVWFFASFGLAGLLSVTILIGLTQFRFAEDWLPGFYVGTIFGFTIAICFWLHFGLRSAWKTMLFIAACSVAYSLSVHSEEFLSSHIHIFNPFGHDMFMMPPEGLFGAGWVGAMLVLAAALFLLFPEQSVLRVAAKSIVWSLAGGLLGVASGLNFSSSSKMLSRIFSEGMSLFLVWQTGMALVLALVLRLEQRSIRRRGDPFPQQRTTHQTA